MTIPFDGPLHAQRPRFEELAELGYTDLWSAEAMGADGLTPLALASVWTPQLRLGTAILPAYTRGPALLAQSVAALASAAPGRFVCGIGSSSNIIVERWNAIAFEKPYQRTRDTVRFLRSALAGDKITEDYETFSIKGFRLGIELEDRVPILIAALREGMLRLAGREADGAIVNWLSARDAATVTSLVREENPDAEVVARLFVVPTSDPETARAVGRYAMAAYLNVPVYKAFHEWMGRTESLSEHWKLWAAGDRQGALAKIPDHVVDELIIHGSPEECRDHVARYVDSGIDCPALMLIPAPGIDMGQAVRDLAPISRS